MVNIDKIRELKESGKDVILPYKRSRVGRTQMRVLDLIDNEALQPKEIASKLSMSYVGAYNSLRKYEKSGLVVALNIDGRVHYLSKKTAIKEGLVEK